jgi:hypothetical protein
MARIYLALVYRLGASFRIFGQVVIALFKHLPPPVVSPICAASAKDALMLPPLAAQRLTFLCGTLHKGSVFQELPHSELGQPESP